MDRMFLKVFNLKYFKWLTLFMSVLFIILIVCFNSIKEQVIYPDLLHYRCEYYTDKANGGNSEVSELLITDSLIKMVFLLNDAFFTPYIGISFTPLQKGFIDARKYNQISLEILGEHIDRIGLSIYTPFQNKVDTNISDQSLFHTYLNISEQRETYHIDIKQLKYPEWWEDMHHISETSQERPDLSKVMHLNISSTFSNTIEEEKKLEIYRLSFSRNNKKLFLLLGFIYVVFILINFGIHYFMLKNKNKRSDITVSYKALDHVSAESAVEKCIEFINTNYSNSKLSLEIISKEAGVTPRRISHIIQTNYNCNFKSYLNNIRINESKRFLIETDLNIGEIAYKVGFNSQSHFNRVFKNEINLNPSEYRDVNKA